MGMRANTDLITITRDRNMWKCMAPQCLSTGHMMMMRAKKNNRNKHRMWFLKRILKEPWSNKIFNEDIPKQ
jgi:hypothetical protein